MAKVKFSKQYIQPNPLEVDYWVDVSENPYGAVVKYHDGNDWLILNISEGGESFPAYKYYTKAETDRLLSNKQDILDTSKFITEIPSEYITESELNGKGYLTQHQDISHLATKEETNKITSDQKQYTDLEIAKLVNSAPETLDTLYELAKAIEENDTVIDALDSAITNKADKSDVEVEVEVEISNGVYAVTADGELIDYHIADNSCIGVAFISDHQKVMIAKADATNDGSNYNLYWGKNLLGKNVPNLANNDDDTAAMADYNGKANTAAIIASYATLGIEMDSRDMCKALETFNEGGYTDWYIPAAGQLYEFYSNITAINEAFAVISGNAFPSYAYWSSSEKSIDGAWLVHFRDGDVYYNSKNFINNYVFVRFVRDLTTTTKKPLKEKVSELESNKADKTEIPTKTSQLENDSNYITKTEVADSYLVKGDYALKSDIEVEVEVENGVYALTLNNKLVTYDVADTSCIGCVVVYNEQRFMIEPTEVYDPEYDSFAWSHENVDTAIPNYTTVDGSASSCLVHDDGVNSHLSNNPSDWVNGAVSDKNGKNNTKVLINTSQEGRNIGAVVKKFNSGEYGDNSGFSDWYLPSCNQYALIALWYNQISSMLTKIGNKSISSSAYWTSTERVANSAYIMYSIPYASARIAADLSKPNNLRIRLIRDIEINQSINEALMLKVNKTDFDSTIQEIANPEELASASPFDYFLGAKEVDGKWVFKKMAPTEVASVVAELMQPLAIKGQLSGSFNDAGTGIYYYTSANQNGPGGNYGFLISIYYNGTKLQIAGWAGGDSGLKCRNWYLGGIWSDWRAL